MNTIANRIKLRREQLGVTQEQLAKLIGCKGKSTICRYESLSESTARGLKISTLEQLAFALHTTVLYLLGWTDNPESMTTHYDTHISTLINTDMNNRIKEVRKYYGLSQTEFGSRIGVTIGVIRNLETGKTQLTSPLFELFCSIYNVNPDWLTNGAGKPFLQQPSLIERLQKEYNLSPAAVQIINAFIKMSTEEQNNFLHIIENLTKG